MGAQHTLKQSSSFISGIIWNSIQPNLDSVQDEEYLTWRKPKLGSSLFLLPQGIKCKCASLFKYLLLPEKQKVQGATVIWDHQGVKMWHFRNNNVNYWVSGYLLYKYLICIQLFGSTWCPHQILWMLHDLNFSLKFFSSSQCDHDQTFSIASGFHWTVIRANVIKMWAAF